MSLIDGEEVRCRENFEEKRMYYEEAGHEMLLHMKERLDVTLDPVAL